MKWRQKWLSHLNAKFPWKKEVAWGSGILDHPYITLRSHTHTQRYLSAPGDTWAIRNPTAFPFIMQNASCYDTSVKPSLIMKTVLSPYLGWAPLGLLHTDIPLPITHTHTHTHTLTLPLLAPSSPLPPPSQSPPALHRLQVTSNYNPTTLIGQKTNHKVL